jgi:hypothetical protein
VTEIPQVHGGVRVGYVARWLSARLHPAVVEANEAALYALMQAKTHNVRSWQELMVRSSDGADLRAWLLVPREVRGSTFFEFDWIKPGRQFVYQDQISAATGDTDESQLFSCDFVPNDDRGRPVADMFIGESTSDNSGSTRAASASDSPGSTDGPTTFR